MITPFLPSYDTAAAAAAAAGGHEARAGLTNCMINRTFLNKFSVVLMQLFY
jgi:hypothetical protein